ncbi:hypothetical protein Hanom_Chr12g01113521 [Helianthus anomalus]
MPSTIFPSLTTFVSGSGHHLLPHPTIPPQPTIHSKKKKTSRIIKITKLDFRYILTRYTLKSGGDFKLPRVIQLFRYSITIPPR